MTLVMLRDLVVGDLLICCGVTDDVTIGGAMSEDLGGLLFSVSCGNSLVAPLVLTVGAIGVGSEMKVDVRE